MLAGVLERTDFEFSVLRDPALVPAVLPVAPPIAPPSLDSGDPSPVAADGTAAGGAIAGFGSEGTTDFLSSALSLSAKLASAGGEEAGGAL